MKNNKKHITKLFYKFLVDNGVLFQVLEAIDDSKHKTLEKHCMKCKVTNYVHNIYLFESRGSLTANEYANLNLNWRIYITNYLNNKK